MPHHSRSRHLGPGLCAVVLLTACGATQPTVREPAPLPGRPPARAFDIVLASGKARDCDAEHLACFERCWSSQPPYPRQRGDKGHHNYCTEKCRREYMQCLEEVGARPRAFPNMKTAQDWLQEHKAQVLVGSIVLVAGAAFIVSTAAAGALVLVPLAAL